MRLMGNHPASPEVRFWRQLNRRGTDECWPWIRKLTSQGYARFRVDGRMEYAHRYAYELLVGPIPEGLTVDHLCHNLDPSCSGGPSCLHRRCQNPAHLEPVPAVENTKRSQFSTASVFAAKTHCPQGHPYDETNTNLYDGRRYCRECGREYTRRWKAKRAS